MGEDLARELRDDGVDATYAEELLDIGAVWFAEAPPPRSGDDGFYDP